VRCDPVGPAARAEALAAADALLWPAEREGGDVALVEALACGRPVVGTRTGGTAEWVEDGVTGWLAARPRGLELGEALARCLVDLRAGSDLGRACREAAEASHDARAWGAATAAVYRGLSVAASPRRGILSRFVAPRDARRVAIEGAFDRALGRRPRRAELAHYHRAGAAPGAVAFDLATGPEAREAAAQARRARGWQSVTSGVVRPLGEVVRGALGAEPADWSGSLHLHMPGKSGEVFFLGGVLPELRRQAPKARLVLHVLAPYDRVAHGGAHAFDEVQVVSSTWEGPLAEQVAVQNYRDMWGGFAVDGGDLRVNPFRSHRWFLGDPLVSDGPLYLAFADAVGCPRSRYVLPAWGSEGDDGWAPFVLAFPTANPHSSRRGGLPFGPEEWAELARLARARGLEPLAQGHGDDGRPCLPGWSWLDASLPELFARLTRAAVVIGPNSGVVWAACALSPGRVLLLDDVDPTDYAPGRYDLEAMGDELDLGRCSQLRLGPAGVNDAEAFAAARELLSRGQSSSER
jgi:hypothetical protein